MLLAKDKLEKEFNYIFGMAQMFFITGLDLEKCEPIILRAVKFFSVMKIIIFSLLINSMQTLPAGQITIILLIQIFYTGYIVWVSIFKKIFTNFFFVLVEILSEMSILVFVLIGAIIKYIGRDGMSEKISTLMQIIAIFLVLFATVLNLVYSIVVLIKAVLNIRDLIKFKKIKEDITKKYDEFAKKNESLQMNKIKVDSNIIKNAKANDGKKGKQKIQVQIKNKRVKDVINESSLKLNESLSIDNGSSITKS
jgi:hypothetical protein